MFGVEKLNETMEYIELKWKKKWSQSNGWWAEIRLCEISIILINYTTLVWPTRQCQCNWNIILPCGGNLIATQLSTRHDLPNPTPPSYLHMSYPSRTNPPHSQHKDASQHLQFFFSLKKTFTILLICNKMSKFISKRVKLIYFVVYMYSIMFCQIN